MDDLLIILTQDGSQENNVTSAVWKDGRRDSASLQSPLPLWVYDCNFSVLNIQNCTLSIRIYEAVNGDLDSEKPKNKTVNGESGTIFGFSALQLWLVSCSFFNCSRQSSRARWFLYGLFSVLLAHSKESYSFCLGTSTPMKKFLEVLLLHFSLSFEKKKKMEHMQFQNFSQPVWYLPPRDLRQGLIQ